MELKRNECLNLTTGDGCKKLPIGTMAYCRDIHSENYVDMRSCPFRDVPLSELALKYKDRIDCPPKSKQEGVVVLPWY